MHVSDRSIANVGWAAENVKDGSYQQDVPCDYLVGCAGCVSVGVFLAPFLAAPSLLALVVFCAHRRQKRLQVRCPGGREVQMHSWRVRPSFRAGREGAPRLLLAAAGAEARCVDSAQSANSGRGVAERGALALTGSILLLRVIMDLKLSAFHNIGADNASEDESVGGCGHRSSPSRGDAHLRSDRPRSGRRLPVRDGPAPEKRHLQLSTI